MGFFDAYHERRIQRLRFEHPSMYPADIRADYFSRLHDTACILIGVQNGKREPEYAVDLITAVDESIPVRLMLALGLRQ